MSAEMLSFECRVSTQFKARPQRHGLFDEAPIHAPEHQTIDSDTSEENDLYSENH